MRFSVFCPFYHVLVIFPCTLLMIAGESRLIDRGNCRKNLGKDLKVKGVFTGLVFKNNFINRHTYFFNISVAFYSFFWIFSSLFSILMKFGFPFSTSKFREMSCFPYHGKIMAHQFNMRIILLMITSIDHTNRGTASDMHFFCEHTKDCSETVYRRRVWASRYDE